MRSYSRAKYEKLRKGGTEATEEEEKPPQFEAEEMNFGVFQGPGSAPGPVLTWKQGRELLRQYLQEIGFTDTMIDVRSTRIQTLLGLQVSVAAPLEQGAFSAYSCFPTEPGNHMD